MSEESTVLAPHAVGKEFIILIALLMSIVAISIDAMLPALSSIGADLKVEQPNHVQYIIGLLFVGLAIGQLVCGPLSDAIGRKKILYFGLAIYLTGSLTCFLSDNFGMMLVGRFIQGLGVAGPYVCASSIVRDKYSGRDMARVMSIAMMVFIMVPAIAPSLGQGILYLFSWRYIFVLYLIYSVSIILWISLRLEETLPVEKRIPFERKAFVDGFTEVFSNHVTINYTICMGICFGSLIGYLNSSPQIFQGLFGVGKMFNIYFGMLAIVLGVASLMNSRFVQRLGMRHICFRAMAAIIPVSLVFLGVNLFFEVHLWMFLIYEGIMFFCFGLMFGNLNSIAMEPMGHVAGIASAITGAISSVISMVLGAVIGQLYNNTLIPLASGFLVLGIISILVMLHTERKSKRLAGV